MQCLAADLNGQCSLLRVERFLFATPRPGGNVVSGMVVHMEGKERNDLQANG